VLQSLAKHNRTITGKIAPFLPADWTKGPNMDAITFQDLLTHSARFRDNGGGASTTYAIVKKQISGGVQLANKTSLYNNLNFAIFREILPFMEGFNDPGEPGRAAATANLYINYVRQNVLQPVGVTVADCKPAAQQSSCAVLSVPARQHTGQRSRRLDAALRRRRVGGHRRKFVSCAQFPNRQQHLAHRCAADRHE